MTQRFTSKAENALRMATESASSLGHTYIGSEHLLFGLAAEKEGVAAGILAGCDMTEEKIKTALSSFRGIGRPTSPGGKDMTPRLKRIIEACGRSARFSGSSVIGTEHLLSEILASPESLAYKLLLSLGASPEDMKAELGKAMGKRAPSQTKSQAKKPEETIPTLSFFGRDLTAAAAAGQLDPVIGREKEIERLIRTLSRRQKNNPCLIGEPGVGKTAVVEGLAQRIAASEVPECLSGRTIMSLDISSMIAGAKYRGEFEERMKRVMEEIKKNPTVLLFIDEIHTIVGAGAAEGAIDAANILKPPMARGEIQVIGATTVEEYRRHIEKDSALERRFQPIYIKEPGEEEAKAILSGLKERYEAHHGIRITDEAIEAAVTLSRRYLPDRFLPDKAMDLIDEAAAEMRMNGRRVSLERVSLEKKLAGLLKEKEEAVLCQDYEKAGLLKKKEDACRSALLRCQEKEEEEQQEARMAVDAGAIAKTLSEQTGIPVYRLEEAESEKLSRLEETLAERIKGQRAAISLVSEAVKRGRSGIGDPNRPIGSFLFLGPTGVGKTALARALASALFGTEESLIRFDMSEYSEKISVARLIGAPPGYVGYDDGGLLTEKVRRRPYAVVLFDEIEKAHPDIYNLLLQVLEDGVLTDSQGRRVQFKNTILIMTSNLGADAIGRAFPLGFSDGGSHPDSRHRVLDILEKEFRPEFLNRIDEIVIFDKLTREVEREIAQELLEETAGRIRRLGIGITFDHGVGEHLLKVGRSSVYGARALRRAVVSEIENPLSGAIIRGDIKQGDLISVSINEGKPQFTPISPDKNPAQ